MVDRLRTAGALTISLVWVADTTLVGHIAFSPVTIDAGGHSGHAGGHDVLGLAPVGVLPSHQRRGIGDALCREGLARARQLGARACVVLGHAGYYPRFGFRHAPSTWGLRWRGGHDESFFALEFVAGALSAGVVRYRPEIELDS